MAQTEPFLKRVNTQLDGDLLTLTTSGSTYTITNWNTDVALDCDSTSDGELADVIGQIITDLIAAGIVSGTVSA